MSNLVERELTQGVVPIGTPKAYQYDAALVEVAVATVEQGLEDIAEKVEGEKTELGDYTETKKTEIATLGQGYVDSASQKADEANTILAAIRNEYGYPFTAATAADMTDTTKIYVYVGSETGYVFGDWYYHNGTAWTDGGVYNAIAFNTDPTLSISGEAADAKATGNFIDNIAVPSKNLYNSLYNLEGRYVKSDGTLGNDAGFQTSDKIHVVAGDTYTLSVYPVTTTFLNRVAYYASDDSFVSLAEETATNGIKTMTVPSGVSYLRFSGVNNTMTNGCVQLEKGAIPTYCVNGYKESKYRENIIKVYDDLYGGAIDFLEQGSISSGVPIYSSYRVRMSRALTGVFSISVNDGYRIRQVDRYDLSTGAFVDETLYTSTTLTSYSSDGKYAVKLVFCKTNMESAVAYTENIIKSTSNALSQINAIRNVLLNNILVDATLESGTIFNGVESADSRRVRFVNKINTPFSIKTNSGYVIRFVVLYDKETGDYISGQTLNYTEYTSDGQYAVRLVFAGSNLESTITIYDDIIKEIKEPIETIAEAAFSSSADISTLTTLPNPTTHSLTRVAIPYGLLWSDGYCWRKSSDNLLAVSATAYKTIKLSDGSEINGINETQVNLCFSMTKVMTAIILEENVQDLSQTITVNADDIGTATPSASEVHEGDTASYEVFLNCGLIFSDNSAMKCIGRNVGYVLNPSAANDSEAKAAFFSAMSAKAAELGMTNTSDFYNAAGGMRSTPEDMCKLFKYVQENCPVIKSIWKKLTYTVTVTGTNPRSWEITNSTNAEYRELLPEFDGGKTGSSDVLGSYGFVWTSKTDNTTKYITVLMNSPIANKERWYNTRQILNEAYSQGR